MGNESDDKLERILELSEENNKMLRKVRGVQKREAVWLVLKFIVIVGLAFGVFYFLEPYINRVVNVYNSVVGVEQKIESSSLDNLLKK